MMNRYIQKFSWLILVILTGQADAAFRNNNHVFQLASWCEQKVQLIVDAQGKSLPSFEVPVFQDKLPIHLYVKALDVHDQIRVLQQQLKLQPMVVEVLPEGTVRPVKVYQLLALVNIALDEMLLNLDLDPPEKPESVLGKSAEDNYAKLWMLTRILTSVVPPADSNITFSLLVSIQQSLETIAKAKSLPVNKLSLVTYSNRSTRDIMLVAYQNLHLLGRLQRQHEVEPVQPGSIQTNELTVADIYDVARSTIADLHRTHMSLDLPSIALSQSHENNVTLDRLYSQMLQIHDRLIQMTGSEAL